jgi:glycolate oxidase FAD binding subunit
MQTIQPTTAQEMADALREAASAGKAIALSGNGSKRRAGGPIEPPQVCLSTAKLDRVLEYEPRDLTCSVEAGMPYARFTEMLDRDGYMVPLDPPFAAEATIGGVVAANTSGPRRRLYGTARDLVIGMQFATLEGKLIQAGGMVVKNVAGLDMGKLLIGSLGTLAAMTVVNFKLIPKPAGSRTLLWSFAKVDEAMALRDKLLRGVLQPVAFDVLNPVASAMLGRKGVLAAAQFSGNAAVLERCRKELPDGESLEGETEVAFWESVREFTPRFLRANAEGLVVRLSCTLQDTGKAMSMCPGAVVCRAANGVQYVHLDDAVRAPAAAALGRAMVEYSPSTPVPGLVLWPDTGSGFDTMVRIKDLFDPNRLLNRGRFYGRF